MNSSSQVELAVDMRSPCCAGKVERAAQEISGVISVKVDPVRQSVVVEGNVAAEKVKNEIETKTGMSAVIMGLGSTLNKNLGSAVSAISIGDSSVRGLLRMNQIDPETCVVEGNLDGLPDSNNLYVSLHETGDLTNGCYSCGPPYSGNNKQGASFITQLTRDSGKSAQFQCASSQFKIADIYGLSMVVHDGSPQQIKDNQSKRLACGIVARSSGVFENSKRFCTCDGVSIWEEKKKTDGVSAP